MPKKKPARSKKPQTKTKFILTQPKTMPAKEVVAKGKAAGMTFTEKYVWGVRSKHGTKKAKRAPRATSSAKTKRGKVGTKAAYVLGFPAGTPAADVVAKGKADGIKLSTAHVYAIRTSAKAKAKGKAGSKAAKARTKAQAPKAPRTKKRAAASKAPAAKKPATPVFRAVPRTGSLDEQFVGLVLDIGLARATELLGKLKERVKQLAL